jgi:methylenetetrahydrofolate dehydrogenase (NADP+)/methenyltetrahydrofolate cyclohydrolase
MIIDGRAIAEKTFKGLKKRKLPQGVLAAILVGNNSASISFLRAKQRAAERLGVRFEIFRFSERLSARALERAVGNLAARRTVKGIILQLPLPEKFDDQRIIARIPVEKDVDALRGSEAVLSPAVGALATILKSIKFNIRGKRVVVIGRGFLVGRPIAEWLQSRSASLTIFHRSFFDLAILRDADLVVSATGEPGLLRGTMIKKGAILIDFGFAMLRGKIAGDIDIASCVKRARALTPTPGGTGPVLVAEIFRNFFDLADR